MSLAEFPGFSLLGPELRTLLLRAQDDDQDATLRPALLGQVADVLNVFIGLDLLQFVFVPPAEAKSETVIDLVAPVEPEPANIAWFSVDEAGYDAFRDAVTLLGDVTDILNPPVILDVDEDDD